MKYFGYMPNDFINGEGVSVSLWTAGCPHHCQGCHNAEAWEYNNGYEVPKDILSQLEQALTANGIQRNFSILGGEPLADFNLEFTWSIVDYIRKNFPNIKIYLWTGYTLPDLKQRNQKLIDNILNNIDILIDGPYIEAQRDITLKLRGSANQRILYKGQDF